MSVAPRHWAQDGHQLCAQGSQNKLGFSPDGWATGPKTTGIVLFWTRYRSYSCTVGAWVDMEDSEGHLKAPARCHLL